jgi:hypothetical protein
MGAIGETTYRRRQHMFARPVSVTTILATFLGQSKRHGDGPVIKLRSTAIFAISLLLSQLLSVSPARGEDDSRDESLPPELQGMLAAQANPQPVPEDVSPSISSPPVVPENASPARASSPKSGHLLFGGVEKKAVVPLPAKHFTTEFKKEIPKMAPVPTVNQVHKLTVQQSALATSASQVWFRIPGWMAGKWQTRDRQLIGEINYRTGKQTPGRSLSFGYCGEQYGLQQDVHGTCWQFEKVGSQPINYRIDKNGMAQFDLVDSHHPLSSSDSQLVLRKRWRHLTVNLETADVMNERCFESTLTFRRLADQSMRVDEAVETFDGQGSPISMRWTQTVRVKVAPFQPVDNFRGDDLRSWFALYMNKHAAG